jgi:integrase
MVFSDDLRVYIRHAWHVVEPSTVYLENWHIDLIAEYLEAVTAGQIKRLLINMPPRYAKSTCVSIMWPTWVWTREGFPGMPHNPTLEGPGTKWMFASYADELRTKHSLDRRKMLQSAWRGALKRAGFNYRWHDARHSFISRLCENPAVSEQTIMALAGHVSRSMLNRYSHIRTQAKHAAIAALEQSWRMPEIPNSERDGAQNGAQSSDREALN